MSGKLVWNMIVPTSLLHLGAIMLVLAVVLVWVDVPGKGVPWDRVGAVFAFLGGFSVGGAAAGWVGDFLSDRATNVINGGESFTKDALGVGVVGAIVVGVLLWCLARMKGKGMGAKTTVKTLLVVVLLALGGTLLAAVPGLHAAVNDGVHWAGTTLINAITS